MPAVNSEKAKMINDVILLYANDEVRRDMAMQRLEQLGLAFDDANEALDAAKGYSDNVVPLSEALMRETQVNKPTADSTEVIIATALGDSAQEIVDALARVQEALDSDVFQNCKNETLAYLARDYREKVQESRESIRLLARLINYHKDILKNGGK